MSNAARDAFDGVRKHFQFAEWPAIEKSKKVELEGTEQGSSYIILDKERNFKEGTSIRKTAQEVTIGSGETLRVIHCHVQFHDVSD